MKHHLPYFIDEGVPLRHVSAENQANIFKNLEKPIT